MRKGLFVFFTCSVLFCTSLNASWYSHTAKDGNDDKSFAVTGKAALSGTVIVSQRPTVTNSLFSKLKKKGSSAVPSGSDILVNCDKVESGWASGDVLGVKIRKWTGQYTVTAQGVSQPVTFRGRIVGDMDFLSADYGDKKFEYKDAGVHTAAPVVDATLTSSAGKVYLLQKVEELHWVEKGSKKGKKPVYPHEIPNGSKIQITNADNLVYADFYPLDNRFTVYDTASDEDVLCVCQLIGAFCAWNAFDSYCTAQTE